MSLPFTSAPTHICLLRLSAVGDVCHALPVVRTIQAQWPETNITWIIGRLEASLIGDIPDVEFIIFDKSRGIAAYRELNAQMKGRRFDVLLHMQMSLRASLISLLVPTKIRLGFDRERAKDLQWLFTNHKIAHQPQQHVVDSFFCFAEAIGIKERTLKWDIPIPVEAEQFCDQHIENDGRRLLLISPCSSMRYRNWNVAGYAAVADYAVNKHNMQVIISGGPAAIEQQYGEEISQLCQHKPLNLVGKTNLKQLLALLHRAAVVVAPDSGPAHIATTVNTPVIGLYATTNPDRARPYLSAEYVANRYPEAIQSKHHKSVAALPWGTRVRDEGTMDLITSDEVCALLDKALTK
ncbi:MAG: glycosyltransferase family 9 protein [Thiotrichaceae bacterium]|nr:glycosyltransferase family 9 protein [Thiotrichaceae bacterium]PCI14835.1 MAG: glycosyl transferase [Thiotrichales bacterium]